MLSLPAFQFPLSLPCYLEKRVSNVNWCGGSFFLDGGFFASGTATVVKKERHYSLRLSPEDRNVMNSNLFQETIGTGKPVETL